MQKMLKLINNYCDQKKRKAKEKLKQTAKERRAFIKTVSSDLSVALPCIKERVIRSVVRILIKKEEFSVDFTDKEWRKSIGNPEHFLSSECDTNVWGGHLSKIMQTVGERFGIIIKDSDCFSGDWKPKIKTIGQLLEFVNNKVN